MYNIQKSTSTGNLCTKILLAFFILQLSYVTGLAQAETLKSATKKQILLLTQEMEKAFNNNDMTKVAGFYTEMLKL